MRPSYAWQAQSRAPRRDQHYCFTLSRMLATLLLGAGAPASRAWSPDQSRRTSSPEIQEVSVEPTGRATTDLGHPNLASVDCSG
jgi:hypothetical protein